MKIRLVKLSPEFLIERLQGRSSSSSNLPSNTELLDIKYDPFTRQVLAIVRSDSFEETKETYPIPEFTLKYSASSKASPNVASTPIQTNETKIAVTTNDKKETVYPTRMHSSTKPDTRMIEEEFSQEQRRLLSFSTSQGCVIVKPVKFLKAEWDDINEIARSLGGRWVKGDIISYWEIPIAQK